MPDQTYQQAVAQIQGTLTDNRSIGNIFDSIFGVAQSNSSKLQELLNDFMKKKGVLTADDATFLSDLMKEQELERKRRREARTKNTIVLVSIAALCAGGLYIVLKRVK